MDFWLSMGCILADLMEISRALVMRLLIFGSHRRHCKPYALIRYHRKNGGSSRVENFHFMQSFQLNRYHRGAFPSKSNHFLLVFDQRNHTRAQSKSYNSSFRWKIFRVETCQMEKQLKGRLFDKDSNPMMQSGHKQQPHAIRCDMQATLH